MDKRSIHKNKTDKENKIKKKNTKISSFSNYSTKKFGTLIQPKQNIYQDINSILPKKHSKKNISTKSINGSNSLSNSNILMKSTEENLISNININENLFSKFSKKAPKKMNSVGAPKIEKIKGAFLKNAIKLFQKILIKEKEQIEKNEIKTKNNSSTKVIRNKLIKDIINEKNKIEIEKRKMSSELFEDINNIPQNFKFGENKKKINKKIPEIITNKLNNVNNVGFGRRRLTNFNEREYLKIKSNMELNSDINKIIRKISKKGIKNEIKKLQTLEKDEVIGEYPNEYNKNNDKLKSLKQTILEFDIQKLLIPSKEEEYNNKFRNLFICNNLYDSLDEDEIETIEQINMFYIGPNDTLCYIIDSMTLIASFISLIYLPFFLAFSLDNCKFPFYSRTYIIYIFIEFIYIIDLLSGFFRAYYNFDEILIIKKKYMCLNYLKNSFFFDLIEAIPFFIVFNSVKNNCNEIGNSNFAFTNNLNYSFLFLKILKIFKTFKNSSVKAVDKFLNKYNFFSEWKGMLANIFVIICALHISSCYFIFLGKNKYPGWMVNILQNESSIDIYIASLYYIITTLTTVGYGDITGNNIHEKLFQILLLIVGTFSYSWLITYISNYIKKQNEKYIIYEEKVKILQEIKLNYPNLNQNLYDRIRRYLKYNKNKYKYNIKYVLDSLPSSIQNNLIIEIYKPIIKNFLFFKYFDNSDFFVKLVTSMKPILSKKEDILVQEGDVIEEIIFIKKGILSLEIGIDLNEPKKYAEEHLGMSNNNSIKKETLSHFQSMINTKLFESNIYSFITLNTKITKKQEQKSNDKKNIKIIDLRDNEHFGDVLMILNEKSPVNIKVKSKKAELLFLQKTEATEISNLYPNIWKKIVNKSLYNLNQIKNIIRKKIIIYCESNDISISEQLKNKYFDKKVKFNLSNKKNKSKKSKYIKSIIKEVDESKYLSGRNSTITSMKAKGLTLKKHEEESMKSNKSIKPSSVEKKNKTLIEEKNQKLNNYSNSDKNIKKNINFDNINNISSVLDDNNTKILDNLKSNIFKSNIWKSDNLNNKNDINENIIDSNKYIDTNNFERINEEIFLNEDLGSNIINRYITMNNHDKNNFIYHKKYTKEKDEKLISQNNSYDKIDKLLRDKDISTTNVEKVLIDNNSDNTNQGNKKINIYNNIVINNSQRINQNLIKTNKFNYLENSSVESFKIASIYENINKISNYKYSINSSLRQKIKNILTSTLSSFKTIQSSKNNKNLFLKDDTTFIQRKNGNFLTPEKNKIEFGDYISKTPMSTKNIRLKFTKIRNSFIESSLKKKDNEKNVRSNIIDRDSTFYSRFKENGQSKKVVTKFGGKNKKLSNYEVQISKNIEKNTQNLNNPEEYFSRFFTNILTKKQL